MFRNLRSFVGAFATATKQRIVSSWNNGHHKMTFALKWKPAVSSWANATKLRWVSPWNNGRPTGALATASKPRLFSSGNSGLYTMIFAYFTGDHYDYNAWGAVSYNRLQLILSIHLGTCCHGERFIVNPPYMRAVVHCDVSINNTPQDGGFMVSVGMLSRDCGTGRVHWWSTGYVKIAANDTDLGELKGILAAMHQSLVYGIVDVVIVNDSKNAVVMCHRALDDIRKPEIREV